MLLASAGEESESGNLSTNTNELGTVKVWRVSDAALLKEIPARTGSYASSVEFSHDGHLLATSGYTGYVELWNVSNWERVVAIPLSQTTYTARFSPDDQLLVTSGTKQNGNVWKVADGSPVSTLSGHTYSVSDARFSPDGSLIATTGYDDTVRLWNPTTGAQLQVLAHSGDNHYLSSVVWRDNDHFVSNDWRGSLRFWQRTASNNFTLACSIETYAQSLGLALSPDGSVLRASGGGTLAPNYTEGVWTFR
jgi:WD40 repeat protein